MGSISKEKGTAGTGGRIGRIVAASSHSGPGNLCRASIGTVRDAQGMTSNLEPPIDYLMAYANAADPLVCVISELLLIGRSLHRSTAWA